MWSMNIYTFIYLQRALIIIIFYGWVTATLEFQTTEKFKTDPMIGFIYIINDAIMAI